MQECYISFPSGLSVLMEVPLEALPQNSDDNGVHLKLLEPLTRISSRNFRVTHVAHVANASESPSRSERG